jgi:hypothetical protein
MGILGKDKGKERTEEWNRRIGEGRMEGKGGRGEEERERRERGREEYSIRYKNINI